MSITNDYSVWLDAIKSGLRSKSRHFENIGYFSANTPHTAKCAISVNHSEESSAGVNNTAMN